MVVIINKGETDHRLLHWVRTLPESIILATPTGNQIAHQRNAGAEQNLGDWVLFVDSDTVMPPGVLARLLNHNVDLVGAVVLERYPPWRVCAIRTMSPPTRWTLADLPREGLLPVPMVGTGCLLVRSSVFARLGRRPWFRCGQISGYEDLLLEDTDFCFRVHAELGVQPFLDAACRVGHKTTGTTIWPGRDGRPWVEWAGPYESREPVDAMQADDSGELAEKMAGPSC